MNKRIEYIDALRGLTMILVVIAHINSYTFKAENVFEYTSLTGFLSLFRMPLFFFVSGYIAYKPAVFFDKFQLKIQTFKR